MATEAQAPCILRTGANLVFPKGDELVLAFHEKDFQWDLSIQFVTMI